LFNLNAFFKKKKKKKKVWNLLDLTQTLIEIAGDERADPIVRQIFDASVKQDPELILIALVVSKVFFFSFLFLSFPFLSFPFFSFLIPLTFLFYSPNPDFSTK